MRGELKLHKEDAKIHRTMACFLPFINYKLLYLGGYSPYAATRNQDGTVRADIIIRLYTGVSNPFSTLLAWNVKACPHYTVKSVPPDSGAGSARPH